MCQELAMRDDYDHVAPRLTGTKEGTFAYLTVRDRWPKIVTGLVDQLARKRNELIDRYGNAVESDIQGIMGKFAQLRYEIMCDKPLKIFSENGFDGPKWRQLVTDMKTAAMPDDMELLTYFKGPWLFVECYLYRFIYSAFLCTEKLSDMDYFEDSKQKNFMDHLPQVEEAASFINKIIASDAPAHDMFAVGTMFRMSLWGNRADMSLTGGDDHTMEMTSVVASAKLNDFILIDDTYNLMMRVLGPLLKNERKRQDRRIDIVLDNAGVELTGDLILALFLLRRGFTDKVVLHGKAIPWFVSDVTEKDFRWTIDSLKETGPEGERLMEHLKNCVLEEKIVFEADWFWTSPHPYFVMEEEAPELYAELQTSSLVIFKGDLNYRKLVGDRDWDLNTSFEKACRGFSPCPYFALRTLKAETVAGLSEETIDKILEKFEEDNQWMTSGEYAVLQLGNA
uniref:Sugar phosphate phosphatase n=1 Tax=Caenorhabditis tropicalis TaxID=1561998 RepID=A0A1I7V2Q8_9PELO